MIAIVNDNLRIGQVAARTGVSVHTIRYYERIGVLPKPARTNAGYRQYSESSVLRIRLVRNAVQFGFSLKWPCSFGLAIGVNRRAGMFVPPLRESLRMSSEKSQC